MVFKDNLATSLSPSTKIMPVKKKSQPTETKTTFFVVIVEWRPQYVHMLVIIMNKMSAQYNKSELNRDNAYFFLQQIKKANSNGMRT